MSEEKKEEVLDQAKALDDQELTDAAGGDFCYCVFGGGGKAAEWGEKTCACVAGGGGEFTEEGRAAVHENPARCVCVGIGMGAAIEDEL